MDHDLGIDVFLIRMHQSFFMGFRHIDWGIHKARLNSDKEEFSEARINDGPKITAWYVCGSTIYTGPL
jgi:hypothetical protein